MQVDPARILSGLTVISCTCLYEVLNICYCLIFCLFILRVCMQSNTIELLEIQLRLCSDSAAGLLKKHFFFFKNPENQREKKGV